MRRIAVGLASLLVALILVGQVMFLTQAVQSGAWSGKAQTVPDSGPLSHRLDAVLQNALGPSDRGVQCFHIGRIQFDASGRMASVSVTWAINHDSLAGTVGDGASADVYLLLRDIYTSGLPIDSVHLTGTYPNRDRQGRVLEATVMRLAMDRGTTNTIGGVGWDTLDAQEVWPLVRRMYVNPQFQPQTEQ